MAKRIFSHIIQRAGRAGAARRTRKSVEEKPLRSELYSLAQLEHLARSLAGWNEVDTRPGRDRLLPRLEKNEKVLISAYELFMAAVDEKRRIAPAGEWLLDNFYLIEEQIRTIRRHFPKGYSRKLPRLLNGPLAGYPRVYEIAYELISHVDGRVDEKSLAIFVAAYQTVAPLKLGELWAIPIMIRLALIENLRRVALRLASARHERDEATYWAERMIAVAEKAPNNLVLEMADIAREKPPLTAAFVAELTRRLQGGSPALALPVSWLEQMLSEQGFRIEQLVQIEGQQQAFDQVSIGNTINSLRFLGAIDWREFVDDMSVVEKALRSDPGGAYGGMNFATRDRYRHVVEKISRRTGAAEEEVAQKAVMLAQERSLLEGADDRTAHAGYFLIDKGLPDLEKAMGMRRTFGEVVSRIGRRFPLFFYLGTAAVFTSAATAAGLSFAYAHGAGGALMWGLGALLLLCSSRFALAVTNWLTTAAVAPTVLARMDFSEGIPPGFRTLAVVPSMIGDKRSIDALIEDLEVRYLANRDDNLFFGLLTDFYDAPSGTMPEDEGLLKHITRSIEKLNRKYAGGAEDRFFLFHRPRSWNPREKVWMAYERKRGKLFELNFLLKGEGFKEDGYLVVGDVEALWNVKYVITLDTDTHMPLGSARELVAAMAHPLNRAVYDEKLGRVKEGYGILQPRMAMDMSSANRSWFVRLFGGDPGIDPYTQAVSDVYQDVFGEGSFIGKGIYDVDMFLRSLAGRLPDNLILSHDLL
ncbi:MAG: cyclic beta 1-2 glucan synthetase, partial [Candidatus Omnitrophota bacterium]